MKIEQNQLTNELFIYLFFWKEVWVSRDTDLYDVEKGRKQMWSPAPAAGWPRTSVGLVEGQQLCRKGARAPGGPVV